MKTLQRLSASAVVFVACASLPAIGKALAAAVTGAEITAPGLLDKVLSECGLIAGVFGFLACYFAASTAKTRTEWTADRAGMMTLIRAQDENYTKLSVAYGRLEVMLSAAQRK